MEIMNTSRKLTAVLVTASLCVVSLVSQGHASTNLGGQFLGQSGYYNYSPEGSWDSSTNIESYTWCGDYSQRLGDQILQERINTYTGAVVTPESSAVVEGPAGTWDDDLVCNPSNEIKGNFSPFGDGVIYSYAMYFVGCRATGANQIGAAFSKDGVTWKQYANPVVPYSGPGYGAGQPSVMIQNGIVTLMYEQTSADGTSTDHWMATSVDGVNFLNAQKITYAGVNMAATSEGTWGAMAYSPSTGLYYALFNETFRDPATTGGVAERGQPGVILYSTPDPINGSWTEKNTIDTNLTGAEANFIGGFHRNPDGTLPSGTIELFVSTSLPLPAWDATSTQAANSGAFNNWLIWWHNWTAGAPWRTFERYYSATAGRHEVTTGYVAGVFAAEGSEGKIAEAPTGDANVPLYGCKAGTKDYFVSPQAGCEGQYKLGLDGYVYATAGTGRTAIYRCYAGSGDHFVSWDSKCEGQVTEGLLGYTQN